MKLVCFALLLFALIPTPATGQNPLDLLREKANQLLKGPTTPTQSSQEPVQTPSPQQGQQSQQPKPRETVRQVIDTSATSWDCYVSMKDGGTERFSVQAPSDKAAKEELHKKLGERAYAQFASCSPENRPSSASASANPASVSAPNSASTSRTKVSGPPLHLYFCKFRLSNGSAPYVKGFAGSDEQAREIAMWGLNEGNVTQDRIAKLETCFIERTYQPGEDGWVGYDPSGRCVCRVSSQVECGLKRERTAREMPYQFYVLEPSSRKRPSMTSCSGISDLRSCCENAAQEFKKWN